MEDFVPFSIALKLNEKGFNEDCYTVYNTITMCIERSLTTWKDYKGVILAPTISQALKWLEKEKKVFIDTKTHIDLNGNYHFSYSIIFNGKQERQDYTFFDWERIDAYITAIDDALDNIIT